MSDGAFALVSFLCILASLVGLWSRCRQRVLLRRLKESLERQGLWDQIVAIHEGDDKKPFPQGRARRGVESLYRQCYSYSLDRDNYVLATWLETDDHVWASGSSALEDRVPRLSRKLGVPDVLRAWIGVSIPEGRCECPGYLFTEPSGPMEQGHGASDGRGPLQTGNGACKCEERS